MAKTSSLTLVLVQAGPTDWDDQGRISGVSDHPLSRKGRANLTQIASELGIPLEMTLCGPEEACLSAAEFIAAAGGSKIKEYKDLHEVAMGCWEGMRSEELLQRYTSAYRGWKKDPSVVTAPEGEALETARRRLIDVVAAEATRFADAGESVAVIVRPLAFGLLRCWLTDRPTADLWDVLESSGPMERMTVDRAWLRQSRQLAREAV